MSIDDKTTIDERRCYQRKVQSRYLRATHRERGRFLDELQAITELDRKTLIRLIKTSLERKPRRKQRDKTYGAEVYDALRVISESLD